MTDFPITPAVDPNVLAAVAQVTDNGANVKADISVLQKLVAADKSAIIAAIVHVSVLLVAAFKLHLSADDIAWLGTIVTTGLTYFVQANLSSK